MRGTEDPHIGRRLTLLADRTHRLLLDHTQQLHLHVQRQIADLVEEQCSALSRLHHAFLVRHSAGETAALVTEELALHQFSRNGAAVHSDERTVTPRSGVMDELRYEFLARARFAVDMYRGLTARDLGNGVAELLHGLRLSEEPGSIDRRRRVTIAGGYPDRGTDQLAQPHKIQGLGDKVERAELQRAHRGFDVPVSRDHGNRHRWSVGLNPFNQVQTVAIGKTHVGQAQIEMSRAQ